MDLVRSSQRPINQVARELGMSHETLRNWVRAAGRRTASTASGGGGLSMADKDAEIARLRRENAELRQEKEILRKRARPAGSPRRRGRPRRRQPPISPRRWIGDQPLPVHLRPPRRVRRQAAVSGPGGVPLRVLPLERQQITRIHADSGGAYGSPRVTVRRPSPTYDIRPCRHTTSTNLPGQHN